MPIASAPCSARYAVTWPGPRHGVEVLATVGFVFGTGTLLAVGIGFLLRSAAAALVSVFLLILVLPLLLPQFGYDWLTETTSIVTMLG
jgi:ABC-2 type transport system permease protein